MGLSWSLSDYDDFEFTYYAGTYEIFILAKISLPPLRSILLAMICMC